MKETFDTPPIHPFYSSVNSALWASSCKSCPELQRDTKGAYLPYPQYTSEFDKKLKKVIGPEPFFSILDEK